MLPYRCGDEGCACHTDPERGADLRVRPLSFDARKLRRPRAYVYDPDGMIVDRFAAPDDTTLLQMIHAAYPAASMGYRKEDDQSGG